MYKKISLTRFLMAAIVVTIPAVILQETGNKYLWAYVTMIVLALCVYYNQPISSFVRYIGGVK